MHAIFYGVHLCYNKKMKNEKSRGVIRLINIQDYKSEYEEMIKKAKELGESLWPKGSREKEEDHWEIDVPTRLLGGYWQVQQNTSRK